MDEAERLSRRVLVVGSGSALNMRILRDALALARIDALVLTEAEAAAQGVIGQKVEFEPMDLDRSLFHVPSVPYIQACEDPTERHRANLCWYHGRRRY